MEQGNKFSIKRNIDMIIPFGVIGIVLMMIVPLPKGLLDILLAVNITISVVIILLTMFTTDVLQFSVFPTLLLITTLFRLGLNISSTRMILLYADAGKIIETFATFVAGNNIVVGIIIFLILVLVNFIVITNGAGRVSEVAARFTLDAMPGKQMSIDADLNAGMIDEVEAKRRRNNLQLEADFYGAMDGASKFVKGDAIAGIVITIINIIAGIAIGSMSGMAIGEAANTYINLTIGDGLVSQIPSILISVATGIITTRSGSENLGTSISGQLTAFPKVMFLATSVLMVLFFIPGMPKPVFLILAIGTGTSSFMLYKEEKEQVLKDIEEEETEIQEIESREPENVVKLIQVEPLEIEIGYGLIPLADEGVGGDLLQRVTSVRRQCAIELGIIVQPIRIMDNLQLNNNEYRFKLRGTDVVKGELMPNMFLCMNPTDENFDIPGIKTIEPTFGIPAVWINSDEREDAEIKGFTVVDPTTVLVTHLTETIKSHAYELLGRQETKSIVDNVKEKYPTVVEELIPDLMTIGEVQKVLQNLLKEKVSIKDTVTIFETLADYSRTTKDIEMLTEYARFSLARNICNNLKTEEGFVRVVTLSNKIENLIGSNIQKTIQGSFPALSPDDTQSVFISINNMLDNIYFYEYQPVILVSPNIRPAFRKLTEVTFPHIAVLSFNEIPNDVEIRNEGVIDI